NIIFYKICSAHVSSLFFFSSRRRHTRSKRDWSSDVCSSDLHRHQQHQQYPPAADRGLRLLFAARRTGIGLAQPAGQHHRRRNRRSEERRVGKECRSRWWPAEEEADEADEASESERKGMRKYN